MRLKLYALVAFLGLGFVTGVEAQDPHISQVYASPAFLNPALAGAFEGQFRLGVLYRNQYASTLQGDAFQTYQGSFDWKGRVGGGDFFSVGLAVMHDEAGKGNFIQNRAYVTGSFQKQLSASRYRSNNQYLIGGAGVGVGQNGIQFSNLWLPEQFDYINNIPAPDKISSNDALLQGTAGQTDLFVDINAGIMYYAVFDENASFYIGGAYHHLNGPNVSFTDAPVKLYEKWVGHIGGEFPLSDELSFLPALIAQGQGPSMESLVGGSFRYSNHDRNEVALRAGVLARLSNQGDSFSGESMVAMAVLEMERWNFGVSYDMTISTWRQANNGRGAFEVSLVYVHPSRSRYKVNCPNF